MDILLQLNILHDIAYFGIYVIIIAMFIRVIASMFRIDERYAIIRFMARITDPFLAPARRIIKPVGVMDLSFLVTWFLLQTLQLLLIQSLPLGW